MLEPRGVNLTLRPSHSEASGYRFRKQGQDTLGKEEGETDTGSIGRFWKLVSQRK